MYVNDLMRLRAARTCPATSHVGTENGWCQEEQGSHGDGDQTSGPLFPVDPHHHAMKKGGTRRRNGVNGASIRMKRKVWDIQWNSTSEAPLILS
jgi:hypothetical protein